MQNTTRKRLILIVLFLGGVYLFYPGFRQNLDPQVVLKEMTEPAKDPKVGLFEMMNLKSNPDCQLEWVGENPLPYDQRGYFKLNIKPGLVYEEMSLIGYKEDASDRPEINQKLSKDTQKVEFIYQDDSLFGVYKKRLRLQDKEGKNLCFSNIITLSLKALPSCLLKVNKKKFTANENIYICFIDPALEIGIYNVDFYGSKRIEKNSIDDLTELLKNKKMEDRRFTKDRVMDLDDLPMNMKDGRDKMCWKFSPPQLKGSFKRFVYGLDGSKEELRICKSNVVDFEVR